MANFIPEFKTPISNVPYFEDSIKLKIPGRATRKTVQQLQKEIGEVLVKLGAFNTQFEPGAFPGTPKRYGYRVNFQFANASGRIDIAALPMKNETVTTRRDALEQALYLFRNKIEAQFYANIYEPGSLPLMPYLIGRDGQTVSEAIAATGTLPALKAG